MRISPRKGKSKEVEIKEFESKCHYKELYKDRKKRMQGTNY
jgi:hypothetical protein